MRDEVRLPDNYIAALDALRRCEETLEAEIESWGDDVQAIAAYGGIAGDDKLHRRIGRIQNHARRRYLLLCEELALEAVKQEQSIRD